jgi:hypothetical protein
MTVRRNFGMRCPSCNRDCALDIQALVWVRLRPEVANPALSENATHEWDDASAVHCEACGWEGTVSKARIETTKPVGINPAEFDKSATASAPARFCCPAGHSEGLRESHRLHAWFPVDATTGEADYTIPLSELEPSDIDEEAVSDCYFYCPTCNDTFLELKEIASPIS